MNKDYLKEIINAFVIQRKHERFIEMIDKPKKYRTFIMELLHDPRNLDPKCLTELLKSERHPSAVLKILRKLGAAKEGYIVSVYSHIDGKLGDLEELLSLVVGSGADSMVYCVNKPLGYYEGHESWGYLLNATNTLSK